MGTGTTMTCQSCRSNPKFTHTVREHEVAERWIPSLFDYIKQDAFADLDRPISYKDAIIKFGLDVHVRRVGRVLDAVEMILGARGSPPPARGGVAAYIVNAATGEPGDGWTEIWQVSARDARESARAYVRDQVLGD
jgi:hypothetical protein